MTLTTKLGTAWKEFIDLLNKPVNFGKKEDNFPKYKTIIVGTKTQTPTTGVWNILKRNIKSLFLFLVIEPVKFLGQTFHGEHVNEILQEQVDYLKREISRLHDELDRERKEKSTWQEMFHKTLGISTGVEEAKQPTKDFQPINVSRRPWKSIVSEFEKSEKGKLKKEVNE